MAHTVCVMIKILYGSGEPLVSLKGVQFGSQNFFKIWDLTNLGKKMTMEILFFYF
jgi:hypothetical protein